MDDAAAKKDYLERLRGWRNAPAKDLSMRFVAEQFKRDVARPHKQVAQIVEVWERLVPPEVGKLTGLASLVKGTLTVHVADSAALYELDRLMRGGLERQIQQACRATVKKVKLVVKAMG